MSILDLFKIAGVMVGVLWWWWVLVKYRERQGEPFSLVGYLGAAIALPMFLILSIYGVLGLLSGVCWLGLIPASQAIAICY